jgi:ribose transport system ATP-binding protein
VDIEARAEIHHLVREAAKAGATVLVVSSDLEELAALCHRVIVLVDGRVTAEVAAPGLTAERLERLSYGANLQEKPT